MSGAGGRRFLRVPGIIRRRPYTLPAMGGALLVAALIGVQLGRSAVASIDPIHFQGPAVHPRDRGAAIDPNAVPPAQARFTDAYGWEQGKAARLADCEGCGPEPYGDQLPVRRVAEPAWAESTPAIELEPWAPGEVSGRRDDIERYADYPIEEEADGKPEPE